MEVVRFMKHGVLLHEQLLVELLYYLRKKQQWIVNYLILRMSSRDPNTAEWCNFLNDVKSSITAAADSRWEREMENLFLQQD